MTKHSIAILGLAVSLGACTTMPVATSRPLAVAPAPVTFDGHVAAQAADYVFVLVPDANPATPGVAMLSGEVLRSAAFPAAAGGGKPNPGLLAVQFRAGDAAGWYRPTFELIGGNSYQ